QRQSRRSNLIPYTTLFRSTAIAKCEPINIYPCQLSVPSTINVNMFITTAHIPYLNKEVTASASIYGIFLPKIKNNKNMVKNNVAVGLSGTKGKKIVGVILS